jgi:hypothetical protein
MPGASASAGEETMEGRRDVAERKPPASPESYPPVVTCHRIYETQPFGGFRCKVGKPRDEIGNPLFDNMFYWMFHVEHRGGKSW